MHFLAVYHFGVHLPERLRAGVEELCSSVPGGELTNAAARISDRYRAADFRSPALRTELDRIAYAAVRMPATYAACRHVFEQLRRAAPNAQPESLLDVGAGPGTATWVGSEVFPSLRHFTLVERDARLIALGKKVASGTMLDAASWQQADVAAVGSLPVADIVVISYLIGELANAAAQRLFAGAWAAAKQFLVVVEPGTKRGFAAIAEIRRDLIAAGAKLAAPCPHENMCPMLPGFDREGGDWCHFAERVERSSLHRFAKQGSLGHEDEKFSYVIGSKLPVNQAATRIVRHPQKHGGHVQLELCTPEGLRCETVARSQKDVYRSARKAEWGDRWPD
jgi:ribosomal protein RSM22 (predicted rRNA methylase)